MIGFAKNTNKVLNNEKQKQYIVNTVITWLTEDVLVIVVFQLQFLPYRFGEAALDGGTEVWWENISLQPNNEVSTTY